MKLEKNKKQEHQQVQLIRRYAQGLNVKVFLCLVAEVGAFFLNTRFVYAEAGTLAHQSLVKGIKIPGGKFLPQYGPGGSKKAIQVSAFRMDVTPVTRAQYALFLTTHPEWQKEKVRTAFAEKNYLKDWHGVHFPKGTEQFPVVYVSYFAAAAYCKWQEGRLPTVIEWEYVAKASEKSVDGTKEPKQVEEWLKLYSSPQEARPVRQSRPNFYGIYDLHGMVWEWTQDYNTSIVTMDSREEGNRSEEFFCGSSAASAEDKKNYPAFLRYAMRGGLKPHYTVANQGFRCAYDEVKK